MFKAVVARAELAINDANKNELYLMKVTNVRSVVLTLDSPASKVYEVEFEAARTDAPKGADLSEVPIPAVSAHLLLPLCATRSPISPLMRMNRMRQSMFATCSWPSIRGSSERCPRQRSSMPTVSPRATSQHSLYLSLLHAQ